MTPVARKDCSDVLHRGRAAGSGAYQPNSKSWPWAAANWRQNVAHEYSHRVGRIRSQRYVSLVPTIPYTVGDYHLVFEGLATVLAEQIDPSIATEPLDIVPVAKRSHGQISIYRIFCKPSVRSNLGCRRDVIDIEVRLTTKSFNGVAGIPISVDPFSPGVRWAKK